MAEPFSTNELFLRSDRIAFGKTPPDVPERTEQTLILPDITGSKLFFGLSTLVSTSGLTGTLEAIYPQNASFTFDNLNKRLGINLSTPLYAIDISSTTGIRLQGGTLVANASGLLSVPTAALFSTLPTYVFAPGSIPPQAIASTGAAILGISVPTSALYGTLPSLLFAPSSIPLLALQSSGVIVASSFVGDGYFLSNIPLANINGTVTGDFFRPNSIPLSTLASTGQIWIRNPTGAVYAPIMSTSQIQISSLTANSASTSRFTTGSLIASSIQADKFTSVTFNTLNISTNGIETDSLRALQSVSTGLYFGDGQYIKNVSASNLSGIIPRSNFGYRIIPIDSINPYGDWSWLYGTITLTQNAPLISYGDITASSFHGGYFIGDGSRLSNLDAIPVSALRSTVGGLGSAGYISSTQLLSTTKGLEEYVSSFIDPSELASSILSFISSSYFSRQLASTVEGLGTSGYISSLSLTSTIDGLGTTGYVSSPSLYSSIAGSLSSFSTAIGPGGTNMMTIISTVAGLGTSGYISSLSLRSTIDGLGTAGYISSSQLLSTTSGYANEFHTSTLLASTIQNSVLSTQAIYTSSLVGNYATLQNDLVANAVRANLVTASTSVSILDGGLLIQNSSGLVPYTIYLESHGRDIQTQYVVNDADQWDVRVLQTTGNYVFNNFLGSDILTLTRSGSAGILCNAPSYTLDVNGDIHASGVFFGDGSGLYNLNSVSTLSLQSTVEGLGSAGYVSTASLYSSIAGSLSSFSTAIGPGGTNMLTIISTVEGLGSAGYISTSQLVSTTKGLEEYVSSFIDPNELASSIIPFISSTYFTGQLVSTVQGLGSAGYVSTASLYSSIAGSLSTFSSAIGPGGTNMLTIMSTVEGLGSAGYVSTASLYSSINGSLSTFSTAIGPGGTNMLTIVSTVQGLGSAGYVSTASLYSSINGSLSTFSTAIGPGGTNMTTIMSTVAGLGTYGYVSSLSLRSTVVGLGTVGYASTATVGAFFSSLSTSYRNNFNTVTSIISALTVSSLTFGTGDGFLAMPDIRPTALSTLVAQTSSLQAFNLQIGATSSVTAIQFYGLLGNFNNTVVAERSTGAGTQELVVFKGSSTSDQIRFQTTGIFEVETGVSSRLWPNTTQNAVPSFVIDVNSNVGIQTANPGATLDVVGTGRFQTVSTLQLNVSSITGISPLQAASLVSTVAGLGSAGYVSTASLVSSIAGIGSLGYMSTASLVSTVAGLGTAGYISTASLFSTVDGLGSIGYISTLNKVPFLSAQQILASSIYATLAGPTTVVLYEF